MTDAQGEYRIYLRELLPEDIDDRYVSWFSMQDRHMDYYSAAGRTYTANSLRKELEAAKDTGVNFFYAVVDKEQDKVIGNIRIGSVSDLHKTSDLVVLIGDRDYLGKGLAKEAIALGNKIAFEAHGIRKLSGGMIEKNIASVKAYLAAGWVIEGVLIGHYLVDGKVMDRVQVACFNEECFSQDVLSVIREKDETYRKIVFGL